MPNGARHWCFTINNPTEEDACTEQILSGENGSLRSENGRSAAQHCKAKYAIWQFESGESETLHIQGYVEWDRKHTLEHVIRLFRGRGHWEVRSGPAKNAREYCKKPEGRVAGPWEIGVWEAGQGKRSDLITIKRKIDEGVAETVIADEHFTDWIRYYKGFREYEDIKKQRRDAKSHTTVVWGLTGVGKSTWIREQAPEAYWVSPPKGAEGCWWDGYQGQKDVVLDDYENWIPFRHLLRLCDSFPQRVQFKGGSKEFAPERIWISSNKHPRYWFENDDYEPLARRIDVLIEFRRRERLGGLEQRLEWSVEQIVEDAQERNVIPTIYQGQKE